MTINRGYPWLKLHVTMLDEPRFMRLSDSAKARYIEFLLLAGRADAGGMLVVGEDPGTIEILAYAIRQDPTVLAAHVDELINSGLLVQSKNGFVLSRFLDEQGPSMEVKREAWRKRQERRRSTLANLKEQEKEKNKDLRPDLEKEKEVTRDSRGSHASVTRDKSEKENLVNGQEFCLKCGGPKTLSNLQVFEQLREAIRKANPNSIDEELIRDVASEATGEYDPWCPNCDFPEWRDRAIENYSSLWEGQQKGEYPIYANTDDFGRFTNYFGVNRTVQ